MILYKDYLKGMKKCPFCGIKKEEILKENKNAILILSKAPYVRDHLLVVPKKHFLKINKLSTKQKKDVEALVYNGMKKLHRKYHNGGILYREGNKKEIGKTIDHLHYHLIPNMKIDICGKNCDNRKIYSDREYFLKIKEIKKKLKF